MIIAIVATHKAPAWAFIQQTQFRPDSWTCQRGWGTLDWFLSDFALKTGTYLWNPQRLLYF